MEANDKLMRCPFCGSNKIKVDSKRKYKSVFICNMSTTKAEYTISVRCNVCHGRGPTASGVVYSENMYRLLKERNIKKEIKNLAYSYKDIEKVAIDLWNNRSNV